MLENFQIKALVLFYTVLPAVVIPNPIAPVTPSIVFGVEFDAWWKKLVGGLWGMALIVAVVYLILSLLNIGKHESDNPHKHAEAKKGVMRAGVSLVALVGLPAIVAAIIFLAP